MSKTQPEELFFELLRKSLNHYDDAEWLGKQSPLASPYFLGERLVGIPNGDTARVRGQLFQEMVVEAFDELWGRDVPASQQRFKKMVRDERLEADNQGALYACYLLDLRYLRRYFTKNRPDKRMKSIADYVSVAEPSLYLHVKSARQRLGHLLLKRTQPILRPESPTVPQRFVGRTVVLDQIIDTLHAGQSISLTGMGGMGKTTLGAAVAERWEGRTFWFTVRPELNDHVQSFLFALADSLKHQGQRQLWTYLRAQTVQTDEQEPSGLLNSIVIEALRTDLSHIAPGTYLICIDESDRLLSAEHHPRYTAHQALIEVIDMIQTYLPLLLIGQKPIVDTMAHIALAGLNVGETETLIKQSGDTLTQTEITALHTYTKGAPRLLMVATLLLTQGEDVLALWSAEKSPNLQTLFTRLWQRLSDEEREMVSYLSVFQQPIPLDGWKAHTKAIKSLKTRGIIETAADSTIQLFTTFRWHIYQHELLQEQRVAYHKQAAAMYASLGEFTNAAIHYKKAGDYLAAFQVWYPYRDIELLRGHGVIVRQLFESITAAQLQGNYVDELNALKMRLDKMEGRLSNVATRAEVTKWSDDSEAAAEAHRLAAESNWLMGRTRKADMQLDDALEIYSRVAQKTSLIHFRRGNIAVKHNIDQAQRAKKAIAYELARLTGRIANAAGDFAEAQAQYENALHIAILLKDKQKEANINSFLAQLLAQIGQFEKAIAYANKYIDFCEKTHDHLHAETMRAEIAGMNLQVGKFETVIELGEKSLAILKRIGHTYMQSKVSTYLAEAHYEVGNLEKAKQYVRQVFHIEETADLPYALYTFGLVQKAEGEADKAISTFQQGITIAVQTNDRFIEAYLQRELGVLYQAHFENEASIQSLNRAVDLFKRMGLESELKATQQALVG